MPLNIKFPTLITEPLEIGLDSQIAMINNAEGIFQRYNNNPEGTVIIPTRGKTTTKVIKNIETSAIDIGQDHCLLLKVEEYKTGYDDMYLDSRQLQIQDINSTDKLGSRYNYAMMYPYICHDDNGANISRWVVFIYAAADKDDTDLINTIKCVISKVLHLRFLNKLDRNFSNGRSIPFVSVLLTNVENIDNQSLQFNQFCITAKVKSTKELIYQNVPLEDAEQLRNNEDIEEGFSKKIVKLFTSKDKKSYMKYEYERDGAGAISSKLMEKYSYSIDIENVDEMYQQHFMENCFLNVLSRFLSNE